LRELNVSVGEEPQLIQKTWRVCPRCGQPPVHLAANPFECSSCDYKHHFGPCTAVGGILADASGQILLLIRGRDPGKGKYGIPGGFVDQNETVETALRREVLEEVSLKVKGFHFLCSFPNEYHYCGVIVPVTDLFFVIEVETFDGMQAQAGEIEGWHFCRPGSRELYAMAFESNRKALEVYLSSPHAS